MWGQPITLWPLGDSFKNLVAAVVIVFNYFSADTKSQFCRTRLGTCWFLFSSFFLLETMLQTLLWLISVFSQHLEILIDNSKRYCCQSSRLLSGFTSGSFVLASYHIQCNSGPRQSNMLIFEGSSPSILLSRPECSYPGTNSRNIC